jgi:hypothetical protein
MANDTVVGEFTDRQIRCAPSRYIAPARAAVVIESSSMVTKADSRSPEPLFVERCVTWSRSSDLDSRPSGYEPEVHTLSLDDSIALTVRRPPKTTPESGVLDASWTPTMGSSTPHSTTTVYGTVDLEPRRSAQPLRSRVQRCLKQLQGKAAPPEKAVSTTI